MDALEDKLFEGSAIYGHMWHYEDQIDFYELV